MRFSDLPSRKIRRLNLHTKRTGPLVHVGTDLIPCFIRTCLLYNSARKDPRSQGICTRRRKNEQSSENSSFDGRSGFHVHSHGSSFASITGWRSHPHLQSEERLRARRLCVDCTTGWRSHSNLQPEERLRARRL